LKIRVSVVQIRLRAPLIFQTIVEYEAAMMAAMRQLLLSALLDNFLG